MTEVEISMDSDHQLTRAACDVTQNGDLAIEHATGENSINENLGGESSDLSSPINESVSMEMNGIEAECDDEDVEGQPRNPKYQRLKSDSFVRDAGLSRVGRVARKSSMERLLEEQLNTTLTIERENDDEEDHFLIRRSPSPSGGSLSSLASIDDEGKTNRRTSIYEQKSIDAPCATKGNIISSRTEHLFKQYEKDMSSHVAKPMININVEGEPLRLDDCDGGEKTKVELAREEKERELVEIRRQYQERLLQEERDRAEERAQKLRKGSGSTSNLKRGSRMNRYIALTKGQAVSYSDEEDTEDSVDESLYVDKHGVPIERSGGKVEIVRSSGSISDIKNNFGGKNQWVKSQVETAHQEVDLHKVNSARTMFKEKEMRREEVSVLNRPVVKKVKDPMQVMEMRKKATYGQEEELPQDGVVKKTVIVEGVDSSRKKDALSVYKNLEKKSDDKKPFQKPKARLLSDIEAQVTMQGIQSMSSSASEASDVNEMSADLTVDTVSGYGSAAPCSPSSTLSEDYLSDTKDPSPRDPVEILKETTNLTCEVERPLNVEETSEPKDIDMSVIDCQPEVTSENKVLHMPGLEYV